VVIPDEASQAAVDEARSVFAGEGLSFPILPKEWLIGMRRSSKWQYSTRSPTSSSDVVFSPYNVFHYVAEAAAWQAEDYVLLAHAGRGSNSYAIQLYVVHGPLMLFLQMAWGGVYMDGKKAASRIADCFADTEQLITAVTDAQNCGHLGSGKRLLVVESDFSGAFWTCMDNPAGRADRDHQWNDHVTTREQQPAVLQTVIEVVHEL
jgi:hypothetical protein